MIKTSRQLKDKVRNMARGDSAKAQLLIRNYGMERFLERVSLSEHRDNFILKGGMLVSAMVGLENRATMDIDTSIRNMPLDTIAAKAMVEEIIAVPVDDNICFEINDFGTIMDDAEYSGVRISLNAFLDATRIPLKIDISTGDAITPAAVNYQYKLLGIVFNGFCFINLIPHFFDYLMCPYYPAYTMGCYQIVIGGDNGG